MRLPFQSIFFKQLEKLIYGQLIIHQGSQQWIFGEKDSNELTVHLRIINPDFYRGIVLGGSLQAAQQFISGYWEVDDLTLLLRLILRNSALMNNFEAGFTRLFGFFRHIWHQFQRNTPSGSRRNIAQHYDLSNDFFQLFLDKNQMYSSAIFPHKDADLDAAAEHKLEVICQKLALKPGDQIIEIGTGWGGFAIHAAKYYGCHVTSTTISQQQYQFASQRILDLGLSQQITLKLQDYRQLSGQYDKLVSIEMIEAVGHQYYKTFFKICDKLLKPNGEMLIQSITIQDQAFHRAKKLIDFIKYYICPGSCIPSITALTNALTQASQMKIIHLEDIGFHYASTLKHWQDRFNLRLSEVKTLGFDEQFIRMWQYYLSYCEAGFAEGYLGDVHLHCVKQRQSPVIAVNG